LDKHYSDEELLSCLDGEISRRKRKRINQHLEFCWACRSRQAEIEKQIQTVSALVQELPVHSDWHRAARENIALFQSQFEVEITAGGRFRFFRKVWIPVAAAAACAIVFILLLLRIPKAPAVTASLVLTRTEVAEAKMAREPIHQIFEVKEIQIQPKGPTRQSQLEIWSDGPTNRFASKWTAGGSLKHAIWSTKNQSFVYSSNKLQSFASRRLTQQSASFIRADPDFQSLEAQFISWLENRPWKPIVLLADKSLWQGDGAILQVQRLSARQLRLRVRKARAGMELELVALVEAGNPVPKIQRLHLEKAGRVIEIELSSEKTEMEPVFVPAIFYPDRTVLPFKMNPPENDSLPPPGPIATDHSEPPISQEEVDRIVRTVEAHYILHLAGACKGKPVTVSQEGGGVKISSKALGSAASYFTRHSSLEDVMGALAEMRNRVKTSQGRNGDAGLAADANALDLLATDFDASKVKAMPHQSASILRRIVRDHVADMQRAIAELQNRSSDTSIDKYPAIPHPKDWRNAASLLSQFTGGQTSQSRLALLSQVSGDLDELFEQEMNTARRLARAREGSNQSR